MIPQTLNKKDMSALLGITERQLKNYMDASQVQYSRRGNEVMFDVKQTIQAYVAIQTNIAIKQNRTESGSGTAKERKELAEAAIAELKYEQMAERLIPIDEMNHVVNKIVVSLRQGLLAIPGLWTPQLVGKNQTTEMANVLTRLSTDLMLTSLDHAIDALNSEDDGDDAPLETESESETDDDISRDD